MSLITPDYLICVNCESPCYAFEWREGDVVEAFCETCGGDIPEEFVTEEDHEALTYETLRDTGRHEEGWRQRYQERFGHS